MLTAATARRLLFPGALLVTATCASPTRGLAAGPAAIEPPLELPKITVTDLRPLPLPESWRYAQVPGLEILTSTSDRETQKLLRDFQLFDMAISVVWPALKAHRPVPMSLILCGPGKNFAAFVPDRGRKSADTRASVFLKNPEQVAIALNFGIKTIELNPAEADASTPTETAATDSTDPLVNIQVDYYRQLYREYVRYQLSFNQPRLPAWLEEGLAQLLMGMKVEPKFIEFAKIEDPNLVSVATKQLDKDPDTITGAITPPGSTPQEEHDFNGALHHKGLIPLAEFFAVGYDSPELNNTLTGKWAKQAQALVHMWLYGEGQRYNKGFAQFVGRSTHEPVTEAMFKECFKMSYRDMLTALRIYISDTAYVHQEFPAQKGGGLPEPAPLALRDATQAEVGRIKGEAEVLAGHPELAHDEMQAPYARGVMDGPLLASLGLLEKSRGETARARKFLEAAAQLQVVRPRAYLELANLRYAQAMATAGTGLLSAEQTKAVLQPLLVARQQPPPMPEVYELMADVWIHSSATPVKSDLGAINQGVLLFQRRPLLLLHAAELNGKYGDSAEALTMANYGLKLSRTAEARQAFEEVKASLPPVPPGK